MSNLSKLEFVALDISGKNYLSWDVEIHLAAKGLDATITQGNEASSQDKAKAMIFLRHHLDEGLKIDNLTVKDSLEFNNIVKRVSEIFRTNFMSFVAEQHNDLLMKNHEARPTGAALLLEANVMGARDQSEKGNKSGASSSNARAESYMTFKDDDKPGTSQKYDKDVEANLTLKDDVFNGLGDITHMKVDDFFGDRN
ncbi:uncharacterized protein [Solanum lycopersicum]|uniref:uncharacterized protein n=1 Tax=Solanum lycopersicum TaxID=4081 RepID=UPI003747E430